MKQLIINGQLMTSKDALYKHLRQVFSFPPYFGNNLDALWDQLNEASINREIIFLNVDQAYEQLGPYGQNLVYLFKKLNDENANYRIYFYS